MIAINHKYKVIYKTPETHLERWMLKYDRFVGATDIYEDEDGFILNDYSNYDVVDLWKDVPTFTGMDVGGEGAIVSLNDKGEVVDKYVVPKIGNVIDLHLLSKYIAMCKGAKVAIEDVHSIFGTSSKSNFKFGFASGAMEALLVAHSIPFERVAPKAWQKVAWQGVHIVSVPTGKRLKSGVMQTKVDTKATSLLAAKRLFPTFDMRASDRCKIPHDGIVDALLMAEYARRMLK